MRAFSSGVRLVCRWMHAAAGAALAAMVFLTVADVLLRAVRRPIVGTYELVGFLGAVAIGFSIPQTSVQRGQVCMDVVTARLPRGGRRVLAAAARLLGVALFALIGANLFRMGADLSRTGEETPLLHLPHFPLAYGLALACVLECLVLGTQLFEGEEP